MHFQLFIPGLAAASASENPDQLQKFAKLADLTDLLEGMETLRCPQGPENKDGILCNWTSPQNPRIVYRPLEQTWMPSVLKSEDGAPMYYVGIWNEKPPTESELRRHYTQEGAVVEFGEHKWILPTPTTVDARAVYNDDGSMRWEPIRKFSWMCDEAKLMEERYMGNSFGLKSLVFEVDPVEQITWLLKLLRVNYRLTPEVAVMLNLWTRKRHIIDTVLATLGLQRKGGDNG